ncbi:MAG: DUF3568 family protein [Verrucomicrobiota bacterium]
MLFLFVMLFTGGCRTVNLDPSGQTQAAYNYGEFVMVMHQTTAPLATATEQAFKDLDLFMVGKDVRDYSAELKARTRDDKRVTVEIEEVNSRETLLRIKVGLRGDLKLSRALYERIERAAGGNMGGLQSNHSGYSSGWNQPLSGELPR